LLFTSSHLETGAELTTFIGADSGIRTGLLLDERDFLEIGAGGRVGTGLECGTFSGVRCGVAAKAWLCLILNIKIQF